MKIYTKIKIDMQTNQVLHEDSYNYNGQLAWCGGRGSTTIAAPRPTEEEIALQRVQLEMLTGQKEDQALMRPFLLKSMGLKEDENEKLVQMTTEERRAGMTDEQENAYDLLLAQQDRQAKAFAGELPISPAMEEELTGQRVQMQEALSQRLGSNWGATTAGQQAMASFDERAGLMREEARRGQLESGMGLALMQQGSLGDVGNQRYNTMSGFAGSRGGLFQMAGSAMQPYQKQRNMQYDASTQNAMNNRNRRAGMMSGVGSLIGTGIKAYGAYLGMAAMAASSELLKENIKVIDNPVEKVMAIRGVEFDWKPDVEFNKDHKLTGHDIGVVAEELEEVIPEAIPVVEGYKHVEYYKIIPLLVEAVKSQQQEIKELKERK